MQISCQNQLALLDTQNKQAQLDLQRGVDLKNVEQIATEKLGMLGLIRHKYFI